ncbi:glycosyltransferase family 2 protein [Priestia aryabhattai]|uniref:glycosyltransferase family 2 protein n=1 Tax=Priestia aryabhattai TaxID=412384 RepID=UPI001C8E6D01|nr:glycosyltransferase family 2 protein [Priestia aryabhattai]MBX9969227.1 glycosyltransferase family 2 protein [Priestia aryabhattai]
MEKGLVSVIIPTYKGSNIVCKSIDSILKQTYKKVEVIVVDDNGKGTENQIKTEKTMERYSSLNNVMYVAHDKNKNGSAARNTGFRHSKGEYLCFLDDDDLYLPDKVLKQVIKFQKTPNDFGIVYCSILEIYSEKERHKLEANMEGDILLPMLLWKTRLCSSNIMIRRTVFEEVKGFDESFSRHQDWELLVRILDKYKCGAVPDVGVEKVLLDRNVPTSAKTVEKNGIHFIEKMKPIIERLGKKNAAIVYSHYYIEWAKVFLWERDFKRYWYYSKKCKKPIECYLKSFKYCVGRVIRKKY